MSYRFQLTETPEAGLRRIARAQAGRILKRLAADTGDAATIHESRKALKRLKALFRLVRGALSKECYAREYGVVRDVGRALSGPRDLEVMPQTLAALRAIGDPKQTTAIDKAGAAIVLKAEASGSHAAARPRILTAAAGEIEAALSRYAKLQLAGADFHLLSAGAADGLRALRRQHHLALSSGNDEAYHDWRKSAQLHWRHLRLLGEAWPAMMAARAVAAKCLADVLGHDHDLAVLSTFVSALPAAKLHAGERRCLLRLIRDRQRALRQEARATATLLLVDKPCKFAAELDTYRAARCAINSLATPLGNPFATAAPD